MLLSNKFFMNAKILDSPEFYKFGFHKKIVTQKNLPLQAFATSTLRNSIGRRALEEYLLRQASFVLLFIFKLRKLSIHKPR